MNVLVIIGHPREKSFSEAIAQAYISGAKNNHGLSIEVLSLRDLSFNLNVIHHSPKGQYLEPAIVEAQQLITWADHLVFIYPTWWGTMPALLKGFIDRVFTEGFAFNEIEGGTGYSPLLRGKTAQLITTMDTPALIYQLIYRAPGHNAMRRAILEFCGFELATTLSFGPVKNSSVEQREKWLRRVNKEAVKLKHGTLSPAKKISLKMMTWIKAIRLQFYPMTAVAYASGALAASRQGDLLQSTVFWFGYAWLFFLEVTTVLINERADYDSDKANNYFSQFTGGSRVIVDKLLTFAEIKKGIIIAFFLSVMSLSIVLANVSGNLVEILFSCAVLIVLALGYTAAPLKLSYRTLGEITVGITHSFAVILCGYLFMGGKINDLIPWMIGLPLFLAVLPSILLAGIPDHEADKAVGKITLAVRFGKKNAARLAMVFTGLSALTVVLFAHFNSYPEVFKGILYFVVPHAIWLTILLNRYIENQLPSKRIDSLIIAALTYLIWFGLIPLINLFS